MDVFLIIYLRNLVILGLIRPLRSLLGFSGTFILSFTVTLFLFETTHNKATKIVNEDGFFAFVILELCMGIVLGLIIHLIAEVVPFVGRLIDTFRGSQFSEQFAPELGPRDSVLEMYGGLLAPAIIFSKPYFNKIIEFLVSFDLLGLKFLNVSETLEKDVLVHLTTLIFDLSLLIVFPFILFTFLFEISFATFQKLYPKLQVGLEVGLIKTSFGTFFCFLILICNDKIILIFEYFINRVEALFKGLYV